MAHAKLVRYMVTMWIQLIHVLYFQEHASRASRKYIPGIVIGRVREPEPKHLGGRGNYNKTSTETITIKLQIICTQKNGPIYSHVLTTGSLIASALYIVIPGSSLIRIKISKRASKLVHGADMYLFRSSISLFWLGSRIAVYCSSTRNVRLSGLRSHRCSSSISYSCCHLAQQKIRVF